MLIVRLKVARPASISSRLSLAHERATKHIAMNQTYGTITGLINRVRPLYTRDAGLSIRSRAEPGTAEGEVENGDYSLDPSLDFDWRLALNLAGCAFEAYNGLEKEKGDGKGTNTISTTIRATTVSGTEITFVDASFLAQKMAGLLQVQVLGASGLKVSDWWPWSSADPYCRVSLDGWSAKTPTIENSLEPRWNSTLHLFVADANPQKRLMLRVLDKDSSGSDDLMGAGAVSLGSFLSEDSSASLQQGGSSPLSDEEITVPLTGDAGELQIKLNYKSFKKLSTTMSETVLDKVTSNRMGDPVVGAPAAAFLASPWRQLKKSLLKDSEDAAAAVQLDPVVFIDNPISETQAWLFWNPQAKTVVVSFRGTEQDQLKDILTDLSLIPADLEEVLGPQAVQAARDVEDTGSGEGKDGNERESTKKEKKESIWVHAGFLAAYRSVRTEILQLLDIMMREQQGMGGNGDANGDDHTNHHEGWTVYLTGHSLGGALSTLCAYDLASRSESGWRRRHVVPPRALVNYSYGSPRVGNRAFARAFNDLVPNCWRVVNNNDAVTSVPRLLGYSHVGHCVTITPDGNLSKVLHSIRELGEGTDVSDVAAAAIDAIMTKEDSPDSSASPRKNVLSKLPSAKLQASALASAEDVNALMEAEIEAMKALMDGSAVEEHLVRVLSVCLGSSILLILV